MEIFNIFDALLFCALSLECFRNLQACSYKPQRGYLKIYTSSFFFLLIATEIVAIVVSCLVANWCSTIVFGVTTFLTLIKKRKSPLKFTKRIVRMLITNVIILFCFCYFVESCYFVILLPIVTLISWIICLPIDTLIARYYLQKAVKKLSQSNLTVIAITGSYGKTCTKEMLMSLLRDSIAPTGSCNTPLGIASFVNKTDLTAYKYLILEFGARNVGDILKLCKLFSPKFGIITGVCEQHLSTFKTLHNVVKTKGELATYLPVDGFCILNGSDKNLKMIAPMGNCCKIFTNRKFVDCVQTTLRGTAFQVVQGEQIYSVKLPQISSYIVDTFLMCFEMCLVLGQSAEITIDNCQKVVQTPHRMQISHNGSFYIIDDAYNANIKGIANCCQTLSQFTNYKIVLTQGIVEGGKKQLQLNEQCGKMLADTFDIVIAIGKYSKQIGSGARGNSQVVIAKNLDQSIQLLKQYVRPNCIVLFQNDLPDVVSL